MRTFTRFVFFLLLLLPPLFLHADYIDDSTRGANTYWGGTYVNVPNSQQGDTIGRQSAVDGAEVSFDGDFVTVRLSGVYFFDYKKNMRRPGGTPPGDLYISSTGWRTSSDDQHNRTDTFKASEGWDYVVSYERAALYRLDFKSIEMTNMPSLNKQRRDQAWRGGYGEWAGPASVTITEHDIKFEFNRSDINLQDVMGIHWTMKCGNDVVEGEAAVPAKNEVEVATEIGESYGAVSRSSVSVYDINPALVPWFSGSGTGGSGFYNTGYRSKKDRDTYIYKKEDGCKDNDCKCEDCTRVPEGPQPRFFVAGLFVVFLLVLLRVRRKGWLANWRK